MQENGENCRGQSGPFGDDWGLWELRLWVARPQYNRLNSRIDKPQPINAGTRGNKVGGKRAHLLTGEAVVAIDSTDVYGKRGPWHQSFFPRDFLDGMRKLPIFEPVNR